MVDSTLPSVPSVQTRPVATSSLHGDFLEQSIPQWLVGASTQRRKALKDTTTVMPPWYLNASPAQRKVVGASAIASAVAQLQLDKMMLNLQDINAFAKPLLLKALEDQFKVQVDVETTLLCLKRPLEMGVFAIELSSFEVLKLSMLDAALHNFEAYECDAGAYHETSGFLVQSSEPDTYDAVTVNLTVSQFLTLCRRLDIGKKYQAYLKSFFYPQDPVADAALRQRFIDAQKTALRFAAEQALLAQDIEPRDHAMILSVVNGEVHPKMGSKQVWFKDFGLMKNRMTGCVAFVICEKYRYTDELILYVPHDPQHPLKRYSWEQMRKEFKRLFTAADAAQSDPAAPTAYQQFFSQFVPYAHRANYFAEFTQKTADSPSDYWRSPWRQVIDMISPESALTRIRELPPPPKAKLEPAPDPYLAPVILERKGKGLWAENVDLWDYLYEQHRDKAFADALSHAVPTDVVDAKAREAKLAHLLQIGLLGLNLVSMFVPVLGEVMMVVMAGQLLYETLEGSIEWAEGDRRAAKDHLLDVAENLALLGVMAGVGAGARKLQAVKPEPVIEPLLPVVLPNGQTRLWRPDLSTYESSVVLDPRSVPNRLGQHVKGTGTYIRQGDEVYETFFDESMKQWRIKHPTDPDAYQPILESNGQGAWRHNLERPLTWDRLTLLRRMGHTTEAFSDTQLLKIADVSGVSDNTLRKMHMDHATPPPELADAIRLFKADISVEQVIEQLQGARPIDAQYLYALPLVTEMPRWPTGRVLEVFKGPGLVGESVKYGSQRLVRGMKAKPSIRVSRYDISAGELSARVLVSLDESEITHLLGAKSAGVRESRVAELNKQLVDYARTRKPAIFNSLYNGTEPVSAQVRLMQRTCPGLSEAAAEEVLAQAGTGELEQLDKRRRVPLKMLEEARWYARKGRQVRAFAGLRAENIASADSRRLALHALEKLPGWPDTLRLEVREGSERGALLDSIGPQTAPQKRYLVKQGPAYQAFDAGAKALNSLPMEGDNFYASLMHALPDEARQSLGVPQVAQSAELQQKIIAHVDTYRDEAALLLAPNTPWFKPPTRVSHNQLGYYASGRGAAMGPHLTARVRDIYPLLTDAQASGFILRYSEQGKSPREIYTLLQNRSREWTQLNSALGQWVGPRPAAPDPTRGLWGADPAYSAYRGRNLVAQALKTSWLQSPLAGELPEAARLTVSLREPLPALEASFSHVRELTITGSGTNDAHVDGFLAGFPDLEKLTIAEGSGLHDTAGAALQGASNVPLAVTRMKGLKHLRFISNAPTLAADLPARLKAMTALEELHITYFGHQAQVINALDLTSLVQLKTLTLNAPHAMTQWPEYAQALPQLERLDLSKTAIHGVPDTLYQGHEKLWAGLSMDWSKFSYEAFAPAYEYVSTYSGPMGHLMDQSEMVSSYCDGELAFLLGMPSAVNKTSAEIMRLWNTPQTRLSAVRALSVEYAGIFRQFHEPQVGAGLRLTPVTARWATGQNVGVLRALKSSWRSAVLQRYSAAASDLVFELPELGGTLTDALGGGAITELPVLPAGTFSHVKHLRLSKLDAPAEQVRGFLQAFRGTRTLELADNGLTQVPIGPGNMPELRRLDLSRNRIAVTPTVQAQFDSLQSLEYLDVRNNPLNALDVSAMTGLKALNLRAAQLSEWPAGAERLPSLSWIDVRDNQLAMLPDAVLAHDDVLMRSNLTGNPFSPRGELALRAAQQRIEAAKQLPEGALERFAQEPVPSDFPPGETGLSIAQSLLSLPVDAVGAQWVSRLQLLNPALSEAQSQQWLARLRSAGMSDAQLNTQISAWHQSSEGLTRRLNGWLFTREIHAPSVVVSSEERGFAALRIRECWMEGLQGADASVGQTLSLHGLQTGDLPALEVQFAHVRTLDLTGVRFSAQGSNDFFSAFPQLERLVLSGNDLAELPAGIEQMSQLQRLELAANRLTAPEPLYRQLGGERLRWLDLSHNRLETFSPDAFTHLETLDLGYNLIDEWPVGALQARNLRSLNLSGASIETFPSSLLSGNHEGLVAGTNLSDNHRLSLDSLEQLRDYAAANRLDAVMGVERGELDLRIRTLESDEDSGSGSDVDSDSDPDDDHHAQVAPDEVIANPEQAVSAFALEPWLANTGTELAAKRTDTWNQLAQTDDHGPFFNLLSQLRLTDEFNFARPGLTQRVWNVMGAATENTELRQLLFENATTHGTCIDGRILTFSELETRVFAYHALRDIPRGHLDLKGRALLDLSRQQFRLEQIEQLAEKAGLNADKAEVRLQYRIGMTRGWPDGLVLPGQPTHMAFGTPIEGQALVRARESVLAAERSAAFFEALASRDYWVSYLRERYPDDINALDENASSRLEMLEEQHSERGDSAESLERYAEALNRLEIELGTARTQKLIELSRAQVQALTAGDIGVPQPGPSSRQ
jgi:Leucine-rich repeat (LRR) protein